MSQGAGVTSAAAPPSSSIATTAAPLTSPTSVTIPQWKYDLLQRRKTNNCPKTIGAQHNHHQQQQNSLTQLKHGNNTCVSECSEGRDDRVTTKTSSPTHAHAADTVIMTMIKSPTHEHKQLVGHGNNNDEKQFQLQSNNEPNLSHFQFQPHSKNTAFNENNRKLFKKSCEVASFGGTNTVTGTTAVSLSSGVAVSSTNNSAKSKKMVAVQEISDTITKELDTTFDSSEEFQYGPGIVSKLRYRYLTLTLRQNAQKQRANLDSLRRATSLNNLLDHDEEELDEEAEDDKKMMLQHNQHQQQQNNEKQQITCQQQKPNAATTTTKVANNKFMKQNQHSSVHFSSSVEQQQQRTARQIKRGNDTLKRARSVEALLCDNNNKSCNNNNNNRNSWNDSKSLMQGNSNNNNNSGSVTIEDKIHNARERNLLSLDKVPKRLTSIIDDTERPPPDLVKQTLKMFEATANRRGGPNRKANGEVAAKIATFKSIISQEKPIIIYPKPSSPKKSPLKLKIDNMVRKFTSTTPTSEEQPDIIPRKSSGESPTQSTSSVASPSPISELTKKIHNLSIIQTTNTTTIHNSNSVSEQNSCESDDLYDDDDQEEVHDDDDHDENIGEKVETIPETVEPLSVKRISKSALDNIAKAGTTQHFSFKTTTSSPLSTPPTKQIGVIRPIVAATNKEEEKLPLTSREIQKNMINDKKREEAAISNNNNSGTSSSSTSPAWMSAIKKSNGSGGGGGGSKNHHQDNNTMVFNFKDRKEVPDYIENDGLLFRKRRFCCRSTCRRVQARLDCTDMIRPFAVTEPPPPPNALTYETVLCTELPAFDPVPTLRSVVLKPPHLKRFEVFLRKTGWLTMPIYACGLILRIVVCCVPAPLGRLLSPWAALLHIPPCIVFTAGIRVEFVKLILSAFDFWFPFVANTLFMIVFSCVLQDMRVLLVVAVWIAFGCSFLQETYFRDSRNIAMSAFTEAFLLVLLMGSISLSVMDDLHHSDLVVAGNHTLSTKDVLVNVIGTMATLMIHVRTMYRRLKLIKRQKKMKGTATQSLGYRCFIALNPTGPDVSSRNSVVPHPLGPLLFFSSKSIISRKNTAPDRSRTDSRVSSLLLPPLQIHLVKDSRRYDPRDTLWNRIGSVKPLRWWQALVLQVCGATGFLLAIPSIFIPPSRTSSGVIESMGTLCLATTAIFFMVNMFCCQRVLYKRVMLSFDYLFLALQLLAAHLGLADILSWRWTSTCGVTASFLWAQWSLTIDALTPTIRCRLHIKSWMPTCCIMLFIVIQLLVSLDILVWDYSSLRDRVFWNLDFLGRQAQFRVVTFLWSRVVTIFIWYGRLYYILITRTHENALIILRGNVEFDYQTWRQQANIARETRRLAKAKLIPSIPE